MPPNFQFLLYKHTEARRYQVGEAVYVWLRSQYSTGRAVVLATPESLPPDSPFAGRYCVRFTACGSTAHVRPDRLLPVFQQQHVLAQWRQQAQPPQEESQPQQQPQVQQEQQEQQAASEQSDKLQQQSPQQQEPGGGLVLLVSSTVDYRRLARSQVQSSDGVLELGCSFGLASRMLQEHGGWLAAVDNSAEVLAEAQKRYPTVSFHQVDVLEQQHTLMQLAGCCQCRVSNAADTSNGSSRSVSLPQHPAAASCSCGATPRQPPCSVVFADIGGNRQLESLVKLVPWVLRALKPRLLVVKSEELVAAAQQQVATAPQQQLEAAAAGLAGLSLQQQQQQECESLCDSVIPNASAWLQQLQQQCCGGGGNPVASLAERWFLAARDAGFTRNPMRMPARDAKGVRVCRPHNYDRARGCLKAAAGGCPFDHQHCHHCLQPGHRAIDCPVV